MITDQWREEVLGMAREYCEETGIKLSVLSNRIVKDADYFDNIAAGKGCTADTLAKVINWFKNNSPKKIKDKHRR